LVGVSMAQAKAMTATYGSSGGQSYLHLQG
jgi:hypothetical protein